MTGLPLRSLCDRAVRQSRHGSRLQSLQAVESRGKIARDGAQEPERLSGNNISEEQLDGWIKRHRELHLLDAVTRVPLELGQRRVWRKPLSAQSDGGDFRALHHGPCKFVEQQMRRTEWHGGCGAVHDQSLAYAVARVNDQVGEQILPVKASPSFETRYRGAHITKPVPTGLASGMTQCRAASLQAVAMAAPTLRAKCVPIQRTDTAVPRRALHMLPELPLQAVQTVVAVAHPKGSTLDSRRG